MWSCLDEHWKSIGWTHSILKHEWSRESLFSPSMIMTAQWGI